MVLYSFSTLVALLAGGESELLPMELMGCAVAEGLMGSGGDEFLAQVEGRAQQGLR